MATEQKQGYMIPQKAGAFAEGLKLLSEMRDKLFSAYNLAFGEWDGCYSDKVDIAPTEREAEQKVLERLLEPVEAFFKERLAEEVGIFAQPTE